MNAELQQLTKELLSDCGKLTHWQLLCKQQNASSDADQIRLAKEVLAWPRMDSVTAIISASAQLQGKQRRASQPYDPQRLEQDRQRYFANTSLPLHVVLCAEATGMVFCTSEELKRYITNDIFCRDHGRCPYSPTKKADFLLLGRQDKFYGHLEVKQAVRPTAEDRKLFPSVKHVCIVDTSMLYDQQVLATSIGLLAEQRISFDQFKEVQRLAGELHKYTNTCPSQGK